VNLQYENGIIGHLTGSYDAGGSYGLETLEVVGSDARFVIRDACEHLEFYPVAPARWRPTPTLAG